MADHQPAEKDAAKKKQKDLEQERVRKKEAARIKKEKEYDEQMEKTPKQGN